MPSRQPESSEKPLFAFALFPLSKRFVDGIFFCTESTELDGSTSECLLVCAELHVHP